MTTPDVSPASARAGSAMTNKASVRHAARRTALLSVLFAILLGTGLHLEFLAGRNWNSGEAVLVAHLALGIAFTAVFSAWVVRHVRQGLARSQRNVFTWLSWLLLANYALLILTGLLMALPAGIYIGGGVWFWRFETTDLITFLHLWGGLAATAGLLVHLALRHWRRPAAPAGARGE